MNILNGIFFILSTIVTVAAFLLMVAASFFLGWLAIIWAALSSYNQIASDGNLVNTLAYVGLWTYTVLLFAYIGYGFLLKNGTDLPPSFQVIASFLRFPDADKTAIAKTGGTIDVNSMAKQSAARHDRKEWEPKWMKKVRAKRYQKAAADLEIEREMLEAEAAMHKASREYNQAKAKARASRDRK